MKINLDQALTFALIHDLAEGETDDVDAYEEILLGPAFTIRKESFEHLALLFSVDTFTEGEHILRAWEEYMEQQSIEAKYIHALDKMEGMLHISEVGLANYTQPNFHIGYADHAVLAFDSAFQAEPRLMDMLECIKQDLRHQCVERGITLVE